ncbi:MAG: hypothetical protein IJG50_04145 [Clostridia bacterium]|nr:hypothetical protein [Clostridia bacterium]
MKKLISVFICLALLLTLMPAAMAADETVEVTFDYDESLCTVTVFDETTMEDEKPAVLKKGSGSVDLPADTRIAFTISDIKKGYRIKEIRFNTWFDGTQSFLQQSKKLGAMYLGMVSRDLYVEIALELIPQELPVIEGAGIYFDDKMVYPAYEYICFEDEPTLVLFGKGIYSDGEQHPEYYADCQWQYSVDGEMWYNVDLDGPFVFIIPDPKIEIDPKTDPYDLRYVMSPNAVYSTGDTVYSDIVHINSGISHIEYDENGLPMLDEPIGLKWGETGKGEPYPGYISHIPARRTQGLYKLSLFKENEDGDPEEIDWTDFHSDDYTEYDIFVSDFEESGDYYFTVVTLGDNTEYADSNAAVSQTWHFDKPEERLNAPYDLSWRFDEGYYMMHWDYAGIHRRCGYHG